jgi:hypothetical protein
MFSTRSVALAARQGTRGYAAAAATANKSFKPPVALFGIDGTYASALVYLPLIHQLRPILTSWGVKVHCIRKDVKSRAHGQGSQGLEGHSRQRPQASQHPRLTHP